MSELKRLEQEALRELAEKSRREHDVELVVNAARAFKTACKMYDKADEERRGRLMARWAKVCNETQATLFAAIEALDMEA